ncbi:MAG TPA: TIGR02300 family protein [Azospirillum sp.]|nr:TIGR02300 family protein [Azospirillum sp.]
MAKPEWGIKRTCPNCGARYYDLRRALPVCPMCGAAFDPEALLRSRRGRALPVDDAKRILEIEDTGTETALEEEVEENGEVEELEDGIPAEDAEEESDAAALEDAEEEREVEDDLLLEDTSDLGEDDAIIPDEGEDTEER